MIERARLGIDGNAGFALLGEDVQIGECEFVEVVQIGDELKSRSEIRAAKQAFIKLKNRLGRPDLSYYFDRSHPFGD